jgi:hypothetical protein
VDPSEPYFVDICDTDSQLKHYEQKDRLTDTLLIHIMHFVQKKQLHIRNEIVCKLNTGLSHPIRDVLRNVYVI